MTPNFEKNFEGQLEAARLLIEAPGRRVFVLGIAVAGESGMMARSVSAGTTRLEAKGIIEALEHEIARIRKAMEGGAA